MKRKNKVDYSLTSSQRKKLRAKELESIKALKSKDESQLTAEESQKLSEHNQKQAKRKKLFIRITAISTAVILACISLGIGFWLFFQKEDYEGNPIATINLSNNDKIKMELSYEEAPRIVANFIYLAKSGMYDNTTFLRAPSDDGYIVMGGHAVSTPDEFKSKTLSSTFKGKDVDFVSGLKGFTNIYSPVWNVGNYKLGYRLPSANRSPNTPVIGRFFMFSGTSGNTSSVDLSTSRNFTTSTHFGFVTTESPRLYAQNTSLDNLSYAGFTLDASSVAVLNKIYSAVQIANDIHDTEDGNDTLWSYANEYLTDLKIKSISFSNLDPKLSKKITNSFETFVLYDKDSTMEDSLNKTSEVTFYSKAHGYTV